MFFVVLTLLFCSQLHLCSCKLYCAKDSNVEPTINEIVLQVVPNTFGEDLTRVSKLIQQNVDELRDVVYDAIPDDVMDEVTKLSNVVKQKVSDFGIDTDVSSVKQSNNDGSDGSNDNDETKKSVGSLHNYLYNASIETVNNVGKIQLPLTSLISHGEFYVDFDQDIDLTFEGIFLIQRNYFSVSKLCSMTSLPSVIKFNLCKCWSSTDVVDANGDIPSSAIASLTGEQVEEGDARGSWCYLKVCSDKDKKAKLCRVVVDPLREACLWVPSKEDNVVSYKLLTPMLSTVNITNALIHIGDMIEPLFIDFDTTNDEFLVTIRNYVINLGPIYLGTILDTLASHVPLYIANFLIGFFIISWADSIASSSIVRYTVAACLGTIMALAMLALYFYRTADALMKQSIPSIVHTLVLPALLVGASWFTINPAVIKSIVITQSHKFWSRGAFDVPWLGKAYFLGVAVIFVFSTWYFELFTEKKLSGTALSLLIKFFGILFVEQSTPNLELSVMILLPLLFYDNLEYFLYRVSIQYEAMNQTPITKLTGKRLSEKQFEEEGKAYTQRELEKLRRHMTREGSDEVKRHVNFSPYRSAGVLVNRFVEGDYSGLPVHEQDDPIFRKRETSFCEVFIKFLLSFLTFALFTLLCFAMALHNEAIWNYLYKQIK